MTYQEAMLVTKGSQVVYRGKITEVLSVEHRTPYALYLRLAGVAGPVSYAATLLADDFLITNKLTHFRGTDL
jgi:hypothetical protein